jgi:hypothetical protein
VTQTLAFRPVCILSPITKGRFGLVTVACEGFGSGAGLGGGVVAAFRGSADRLHDAKPRRTVCDTGFFMGGSCLGVILSDQFFILEFLALMGIDTTFGKLFEKVPINGRFF